MEEYSPESSADTASPIVAEVKSSGKGSTRAGSSKPTARKRKKIGELDKPYTCDWGEGCTKAFSRPDHLSRHRLNHEPTEVFTCDKCDKHFVRNDLLVRHLERHDKRQANGGDNMVKPPRKARATTSRARNPTPPYSPPRQSQPLPPQQQPQLMDPVGATGDWGHHSFQQEPYNFVNPSANMRGIPPEPLTSLYSSAIASTSYAPQSLQPGYLQGGPLETSAYLSDDHTSSPYATSLAGVSTGAIPYLETPLSFIQASYGAMNFVSADNYEWLFATDDNLNVPFGLSRPVTPVKDTPKFGMSPGVSEMMEKHSRNLFVPTNEWDMGRSISPGRHVGTRNNPISTAALPTIDFSIETSRDTQNRILDYLGPEWNALRTDERMSTEAMKEYLYLFWTRYDATQAPTLHRASFRTSDAPIPLLLSMAVLLIVFGKLCSTRMAHEMAHIFWSSVVTLGRRSALFSHRTPPAVSDEPKALEVQWAEWIEAESSRRIAHVTFWLDTEHAALFRHSPSLSAFQIQITLPCEEDEWEASTAEQWARIHALARPQIPFISALKSSLLPQPRYPPQTLNPSSRLAVLHGLLSVSQDLQWRDHVVGMGQPESRAHNWREMMSSAYNSWKAALDCNLIASASTSTTQLLRSSISLYAVAHITLSVDIHELQIFAGAESALGLVVSSAVREATKLRIEAWANSREGRAGAWHSAFFLRSSLQHHFRETGDAASLHHGWCVYQATLALFCFGITSERPHSNIPRDKDHRADTMRYLDRMCTNSPDALDDVPGKSDVECICETTWEYLKSSRWDIAQEGAVILGKLCGR